MATSLRPRRQLKVSQDSDEDEFEENDFSEDDENISGDSIRVSAAYKFMPMPITNSKELPFVLNRDQFNLALNEFMNRRGTQIGRLPQLGHKELDLYILYRGVITKGGFYNVITQKKWRDITRYFDLPPTCTNPAYHLRGNYAKYLYLFELKNYHGLDDFEIAAIEEDMKNQLKSGISNSSVEKPAYQENSKETPSLSQRSQSKAPVVNDVPRALRGTPYSRTTVPSFSRRLHALIKNPDIVFQKKLAVALDSNSDAELDWVFNSLILRSYENDFTLRNTQLMFDHVLSVIQKLWEKVAPKLTQDEISVSEKTPDSIFEELTQEIFSVNKRVTELILLRKASKLFLNLSYIQDNDKFLTNHTIFMDILFKFLFCKDSELATDALETIMNLAPSIQLNDNNVELLSYLFGYLMSDNTHVIALALEAFMKLSLITDNYNYISKIDVSFYKRLEELLFFANDNYIRGLTLFTLHNLARLGTARMKTIIASQTSIVKALFGLLQSSLDEELADEAIASKTKLLVIDKASKTLLLLVQGIARNEQYFSQYQDRLLEIATSGEGAVNKVALEILANISSE